MVAPVDRDGCSTSCRAGQAVWARGSARECVASALPQRGQWLGRATWRSCPHQQVSAGTSRCAGWYEVLCRVEVLEPIGITASVTMLWLTCPLPSGGSLARACPAAVVGIGTELPALS